MGCSGRFSSMKHTPCVLPDPFGTQFIRIHGRFLLCEVSSCYDILLVVFVKVFTFSLGAYYNRFFCLLACLSIRI